MNKVGDVVIFNINFTKIDNPQFRYGLITHLETEGYLTWLIDLSQCSISTHAIPSDFTYSIDAKDEITKQINDHYDSKVNKLKAEFKSVRREDYLDDIKVRYDLLRTEIINTAKNMIDTTEDESFENKLKAICAKKKQLFSMECDEVVTARKYNGNIKYKIKQIERERNVAINGLDNLKAIDKKLGYNWR